MWAKADEVSCDFFVTNDRKFRQRYETEEGDIRFYTPEEMVREMVEGYRVDMATQIEQEVYLVPERKRAPREELPGLPDSL